ncbi:hypothetical protein GS860_16075 [Rhodococcus hoagii]|nr:hypothetical protein [Prescottella equi]
MSTAEQIIAEVVHEHTPMHDNGPFGDDPWTGCSGRDCADWPGGDDEAFGAHVAAHVVAALTNAGHVIYPEQYVGELRRIEADIEEWANYRVQDFGCKNAKDVLAIINREGEWADGSAAARVAEGGERGE